MFMLVTRLSQKLKNQELDYIKINGIFIIINHYI
jgi:hypothetical protein